MRVGLRAQYREPSCSGSVLSTLLIIQGVARGGFKTFKNIPTLFDAAGGGKDFLFVLTLLNKAFRMIQFRPKSNQEAGNTIGC